MKNTRNIARCGFVLAGVLTVSLLFGATTAMARVYTLWVDGLACPFCSYGIEKQLSKLPGVNSIKINIKSGTVTLKTKGNQKISETALRAAVDRAGFSVGKIK